MSDRFAEAYGNKEMSYFQAARNDIVADLPYDQGLRILEVGCGEGGTLLLAKASKKAVRVVGVEMDPQSALKARAVADDVLVGNVENMELPFEPGSFDVLILSEVLEHLFDPWRVLRRLYPLLKDGGLIYASSPNVAHVTVLRMLFRNCWDYSERGRMDWTHVRWFTPQTYREMIEEAGFRVIWLRSTAPMTMKQAAVNAMTFNRFSHLFTSQIFVKAQRR